MQVREVVISLHAWGEISGANPLPATKLVGSLMVKYWSPKPADMGSNPIPSAIQGYSSMVRALL